MRESKCDTCRNARPIISENGLHIVWPETSPLHADALAYIKVLESDVDNLLIMVKAGEKVNSKRVAEELKKLFDNTPRWIPVEERLPKNGLAIVCCPDPDRPVYIAWMCDGRWLNQFSRPLGLPVTHWMPLPEPPKEENHERCKEAHPD